MLRFVLMGASAIGRHPSLTVGAAVMAATSGWLGSQSKLLEAVSVDHSTGVLGAVAFLALLPLLIIPAEVMVLSALTHHPRLVHPSAVLLATAVAASALGYAAAPPYPYNAPLSGRLILTVSAPSPHRWVGRATCMVLADTSEVDRISSGTLATTDTAPPVSLLLHDRLTAIAVWLEPQPANAVAVYRGSPNGTGRAKVTLEAAKDGLSGLIRFEELAPDDGFLEPRDRPIDGSVEWSCGVSALNEADDPEPSVSPH